MVILDGVTDSRSTLERQNKETEQGKTAYASFLKRNVFTNPSFVPKTASGKLGTHSIRKFATTFCKASGGSKDDTDYRARWKAQRQQDWYTNTQLNLPDINTTSHSMYGWYLFVQDKC